MDYVEGKSKGQLGHACVGIEVGIYSSKPFATKHEEVGGKQQDPAALSQENTRYFLYRQLGGPRGRSRRHGKSRLPRNSTPRLSSP